MPRRALLRSGSKSIQLALVLRVLRLTARRVESLRALDSASMSLFAKYEEKIPGQPMLDVAGGLRIGLAEEPDLPAIAAITAEREGDQPERWLRSAEESLRKSRETAKSSIL